MELRRSFLYILVLLGFLGGVSSGTWGNPGASWLNNVLVK